MAVPGSDCVVVPPDDELAVGPAVVATAEPVLSPTEVAAAVGALD